MVPELVQEEAGSLGVVQEVLAVAPLDHLEEVHRSVVDRDQAAVAKQHVDAAEHELAFEQVAASHDQVQVARIACVQGARLSVQGVVEHALLHEVEGRDHVAGRLRFVDVDVDPHEVAGGQGALHVRDPDVLLCLGLEAHLGHPEGDRFPARVVRHAAESTLSRAGLPRARPPHGGRRRQRARCAHAR